ncbi:hypothetical protein DUNSADRAFT_12044 [Dunaliella salina]|uniref:Proton pump-interactor 1 n=1 Tax=Dunaliella salina TaxID=3046 RepID=A0ABQ7GC09_DUNSA|nr:hypothetical protein DUNSADRAFT_12044 [Dunaliella salina]|eukprot:KAF5832143.1 hypothetical protein DUNSADRAFT_12044 [Dunaliella salina]
MKANRIRELKKYRQGFVDQIKEIMSNVQGTDLRSEAALDERIRQMEGQIASGSISLREEKMVVQNVSRLQALRGKLREFDSCQEQLQYAEGEAQKLKSVLAGMESEFSILKAERDAANGVVQDIQKKINDCSKELEEMDEEEKEMTKAKNDAYEALQKAREDKDASLRDYRENRRFALEIRDMVAAGQAEEAKGLAAAQVEEWVGKLTSDTHLRADYTKLWSEQRKYMVSELLPDSSLSAKQEAAAKAKAAAPSKQAKGKKEKEAAAPARPSTAEQAKPSGPYVPPHGKEGGAAADKKKEDAPRFVENPNAAAMKNKVPLPRQYLEQDEEFVPPVELLSKNESDNQAAVDEAQRRAKLREEQRAKAAEAEERKRKRAEAAEKKKVAAAVPKRTEQERQERDASAMAAAAAGSKQDATEESAGEGMSGREEGARQAAPAKLQQGSGSAKRAAAAAKRKEQQALANAAAKRPKARGPLRTVKKRLQDYQIGIAVGIALALVFLLVVYAYVYR